jgi:hypothetical protein
VLSLFVGNASAISPFNILKSLTAEKQAQNFIISRRVQLFPTACHSCESRNPMLPDSEHFRQRIPAFAGMTEKSCTSRYFGNYVFRTDRPLTAEMQFSHSDRLCPRTAEMQFLS